MLVSTLGQKLLDPSKTVGGFAAQSPALTSRNGGTVTCFWPVILSAVMVTLQAEMEDEPTDS